jgi:hypothetical protein
MKGLLLLCLLLAGLPQMGCAVEGARLVCDPSIFDFGTVDSSAVVTNVFTLRNVGDVSYPVKMVHTSCSCTKGRISQRMIGPGETVDLTAVFTAARRKGPQKKAVRVESMNPTYPSFVVYVKGVVTAP